MAERVGTQVTAPIVIDDTTRQEPVAYSTHIQGGHHSYPKLDDGIGNTDENSIYGIKLHHRRWGMSAYAYNDTTNINGQYVLTYNLVDTDLSNNDNWAKFEADSVGSDIYLQRNFI